MLNQTDVSMIAEISKQLSKYTHEYNFEFSQDPESIATNDAKFWIERCENALVRFFANKAK